jgi:hypothetical protein
MLSVAHAPTGALIATKLPNPIISIPLIILAHYLEDRVPHWDVGTGMIGNEKKKKMAFYQELFFDFPGSILLVYFFFQFGQPQINWLAWMGWFFGLLPDFLDFPSLFLKFKIPPLEYLAQIHQYFHRSTPKMIQGLLPQLAVIVAVYFLR